MSKADDKELEEAIRSMKRFVECRQDMTAVTAREMKEVLNYINNSIPKDKIREKIQELQEEYEKALEKNSTKAFILKCQIEILKELLEGK